MFPNINRFITHYENNSKFPSHHIPGPPTHQEFHVICVDAASRLKSWVNPRFYIPIVARIPGSFFALYKCSHVAHRGFFFHWLYEPSTIGHHRRPSRLLTDSNLKNPLNTEPHFSNHADWNASTLD